MSEENDQVEEKPNGAQQHAPVVAYEPPEREWSIWNAERQKNRMAAAGAMTVPEALAAARRAPPQAMAS